MPASLSDYQVHLRSGHIIPMQNATALKVNTTDDLRKHRVDLHIHPENRTTTPAKAMVYGASGVYVNDDGVTVAEKVLNSSNPTYNLYKILFTFNDVVNEQSDDEVMKLEVAAEVSS